MMLQFSFLSFGIARSLSDQLFNKIIVTEIKLSDPLYLLTCLPGQEEYKTTKKYWLNFSCNVHKP